MKPNHQQGALSRNGVLMFKFAVIYLLLGLTLGLAMAMSGQFQLRPVHTHINLLGWTTLALAGTVYCLFPHLGETRLANWHVWLHNLGLPLMMIALTLYHLGYTVFEPLLGIGSLITFSGLLLFAFNLLSNIERHETQGAAQRSAVITE